MAKYPQKCPGCGAKLGVVSENQDEEEGKMMEEGAKHSQEAHGGDTGDMSEEQMKQHVHDNIKEG